MPTHKGIRAGLVVLLVVAGTLFCYGLFIWYGAVAGGPEADTPPSVAVQPPILEPLIEEPALPGIPGFKHDFIIPPVVDGIPPIITHFKTDDPVVFLTIDDGGFKDPLVVQLLKDNNIKASLYLSKLFIGGNPGFFKDIQALGSPIQNHTLTHDTNMIRDMTYQQQVAEICGMSDYIEQQYGKRPTMFRPPGGTYDDSLLRAAGACEMRAVVNWIAKVNGGSMQYQIGNKLRPGDIVLMHFRPEFAEDLKAFIEAQNAAGLHTEYLEDWL